MQFKENKWQPLEQDRLLAEKQLPEGISLSVELEGLPLVQEDEEQDSWFDEPFIEESDADKKKFPEPQIMLLPSGEMTAFELSFIARDSQGETVEVLVSGDSLGRLKLGGSMILNKPARQKGMTLLEVIVALAVFAIAAVAITKSIGDQIANMPILEERTLAQWVADNQMVDARLEKGFPALGRKDGRSELAGQTWYWRKEVVKTTDDNFRMIRISVSDDDRFGRIIAQVNSYVLKQE